MGLISVIGTLVACGGDGPAAPATPIEPAQPDTTTPPPAAPTVVAFVDVAVRAMDGSGLTPGQTVVVQDDLITAMGPTASVTVPEGATTIAGAGKVLMPGLADMHTHVRLGSSIDDTDASLRLYLANGVTTILNMGDYTGNAVSLRKDIEDGFSIGPTMYVAHFARTIGAGGNALTDVSDEASGRALVRRAVNQGYDFVKVYGFMKPEAFEGIAAEANSLGMPMVGHAVRSIGLTPELEAGVRMVAHAEEFHYGLFKNQNAAEIPGAVDLMMRTGAYVTGTVSTFESVVRMFDSNRQGSDAAAWIPDSPGAQYLPQARVDAWINQYRGNYTASFNLRPWLDLQLALLKASHDAGVPILLGTDSPTIVGMTPGFSLHTEIQLLLDAGLTIEEALTAGTADAGRFLMEMGVTSVPVGQVAVGARADLLLLNADPLTQLDVIRRPAGVMARGRWYDRAAIDGWLQQLSR